MLSTIYPLSFLVSLSGLILWFYHVDDRQKSRLMSQLFLGGFFVYLFSLAYSDGEFSYKLLILFRDLVVLGVVSQFFSFFKRNKALFFLMMAILYGGFFFKYFGVMANTFPQAPPSKITILLDSEGELLVELKEGHQLSELQAAMNQFDIKAKRAFQPEKADITLLDNYYVLDVPEGEDLHTIAAALHKTGAVEWLEENEQIQLDPSESEAVSVQRRPGKKPKYKLNDPDINKQWGLDAMGADRLYRYLDQANLQPQQKASIFILDTGVDAKHEDLKDNYKSIKSRYDTDPAGHGTHCAGIAAAVTNNGKGIASLNMDNQFVEVTSIKVLAAFGGGTQKGIINGIIEAADKGAAVISMSLGGPSNRSRQRAYQKAVEYANKAGAIVVVAAGNSSSNAKNYTPANAPGVITVSAIDTTLNKAHFSNWVSDLEMGIAAPGVKIYSTLPNDKYAFYNGTSMATPYVAGLLGLMKSLKPEITTQEAYDLLHKHGKDTKDTELTG
ncbi:MAG: S8 family serine peptidase, partial [Bacteroidota bacterium]